MYTVTIRTEAEVAAQALAMLGSATTLTRPRGCPDNVAGTRQGRLRPILRKQPDDQVHICRRPKAIEPNGGEPGRPWRRQLARALHEDQQRKAQPNQRYLVEQDIRRCKRTLPKATKLDR